LVSYLVIPIDYQI